MLPMDCDVVRQPITLTEEATPPKMGDVAIVGIPERTRREAAA